MKQQRADAWRALAAHRKSWKNRHLRDLFARDAGRFKRFSIVLDDLLLDYSKNLIDAETLRLLLRLARASDVERMRAAMFGGERINITEGRAVLHTALRNRSDRPVLVDGRDVMPQVRAVLDRMRTFSEKVRAGTWRGYSGKAVSDIVNIGIGGSDLGPAMACRALTPYAQPGLRAHFVSNVDPSHLAETLKALKPERTLFVVASKTFTTQETLANARAARAWLLSAAHDERAVGRHFVAVSTNEGEALNFGIAPAQTFGFWDWVGGRYSIWSAVGLPVALLVGMERFEEILAGGHEMDEHFRSAPLAENMPVILALLGIWHSNFWNARCHAVLPYDQYLERFPAYLQQLDMESNGKGVTREGRALRRHSGPVLFGEPGTNGQHAFYQLLHQGTQLVPCDFLAAAESQNAGTAMAVEQHDMLLANFLAQSAALLRGKDAGEVRVELEAAGVPEGRIRELAPHRVFPGNRPSNSLLYRRLSPRTLGRLIALYEHKVYVQGVIWNINSFDQWGVELGKQLARKLLPAVRASGRATGLDASTNGLLERLKRLRER